LSEVEVFLNLEFVIFRSYFPLFVSIFCAEPRHKRISTSIGAREYFSKEDNHFPEEERALCLGVFVRPQGKESKLSFVPS
jgi:hypothetical protein